MIAAMRLVSVQRGYDPRDFVLVAFGGAGPLHANALAKALGIHAVLVPPSPGIATAVGMLMSDIKHELVGTRRRALDRLTPDELDGFFSDFVRDGHAVLEREGVTVSDRRVARVVDLRYHGQSHELSVPLPPGPLAPADLERLREAFHAAHERAYGYAAREDAIEMVNVRLTAIGVSPKPRRPALPKATGDVAAAIKAHRPVWFAEVDGFASCAVLDRSRLAWGHIVTGPAAIEEMDATTLIHPGWQAAVDEHGNLLLEATE